MDHVLPWENLNEVEIIEFLNINQINVYEKVDELYRGGLKENIKLTPSVINLENKYISHIKKLYDDVLFLIGFDLDYKDLSNLCLSDTKMNKLCQNKEFWIAYLHNKTNLDESFFISFILDDLKNIANCIYEKSLKCFNTKKNQISNLKKYKDIMYALILSEQISYHNLILYNIEYIKNIIDRTINVPVSLIFILESSRDEDFFYFLKYIMENYYDELEVNIRKKLNNHIVIKNKDIENYIFSMVNKVEDYENSVDYVINFFYPDDIDNSIFNEFFNYLITEYIFIKYNIKPNQENLTYQIENKHIVIIQKYIENYRLHLTEKNKHYILRNYDLGLVQHFIDIGILSYLDI